MLILTAAGIARGTEYKRTDAGTEHCTFRLSASIGKGAWQTVFCHCFGEQAKRFYEYVGETKEARLTVIGRVTQEISKDQVYLSISVMSFEVSK
jgi:hypothetical protein